jgi:hypothetical protein
MTTEVTMARKSKDGGSSGSQQTGGMKRQNKAGPGRGTKKTKGTAAATKKR